MQDVVNFCLDLIDDIDDIDDMKKYMELIGYSKKEAVVTRTSQAVPHLSTNRA